MIFINGILDAFNNYKKWFRLAFFDLNLKYRRTILGPAWNVLTILLSVFLMSLVWAKVFNINLNEFLPKLYFGMTAWTLIISMTSGSSTLYHGTYSSLIRSVKINNLELNLRHISLSIMNYLHFVPLIVIFFVFFETVNFNENTILLIPGFIFLFINMFWFSYVFSTMCSRFRDLVPLTDTIMNAGSLLTPIIWSKEMLGEQKNLVYINPFTFFIESIRDPLLGINPGIHVYLGLLVITLFGYLIMFIIYIKKNHRISFWAS